MGGDDDPVMPVEPDPVEPAAIVGTVSGTVSVEGSGLAGVNVSAASQSATTGSSGGYSFANVPAGTHSVQISGAPADVDFTSTAHARDHRHEWPDGHRRLQRNLHPHVDHHGQRHRRR